MKKTEANFISSSDEPEDFSNSGANAAGLIYSERMPNISYSSARGSQTFKHAQSVCNVLVNRDLISHTSAVPP